MAGPHYPFVIKFYSQGDPSGKNPDAIYSTHFCGPYTEFRKLRRCALFLAPHGLSLPTENAPLAQSIFLGETT
jgi:hypothetical protein